MACLPQTPRFRASVAWIIYNTLNCKPNLLNEPTKQENTFWPIKVHRPEQMESKTHIVYFGRGFDALLQDACMNVCKTNWNITNHCAYEAKESV